MELRASELKLVESIVSRLQHHKISIQKKTVENAIVTPLNLKKNSWDDTEFMVGDLYRKSKK